MVKDTNAVKGQTLDVYLERRKSREYVGQLIRVPKQGFEFEYAESYLLKSNSIPLGPEFPLTKRKFQSKKLFPTFEDRIPSKDNPAYPEYCLEAGIDPSEEDPLALLGSIGKRGPSSFIFERPPTDLVNKIEVALFRKELGLSIREFAAAFDFSTASVLKLEKGSAPGREILKRMEIYMLFPEVALHELEKNKSKLHSNSYQTVSRKLRDRKVAPAF